METKNETSAKVEFVTGNGGLPVVKLETKWSRAEIYLHGAHVTHFEIKSEPPLLFMSEKSLFSAGNPIRGGIPVIFPWFGPMQGMSSHGFARTSEWTLRGVQTSPDGLLTAKFLLAQKSEAAVSIPTVVEYSVTIGQQLELEMLVTNRSTDAQFTFEECLHTYFNVGDINSVWVTGLKGVQYLDKVGGSVEKTETGDVINVSSEVDRVYQDTKATVEIHDAKLKRKIVIEKENSDATVVWNPWVAKSKAMSDFGDEEYLKMICIESGNVGKNATTVGPGKTSSMKVRILSLPI